MLISNHNSFRVLFDKIVSVYFIWKKYIYTLAFDIASPGNQHCANCIGTLSFAIVGSVTAHGTHRRSAQECYSPATGRCDRWKVLAESSRTAALTQRHAVTDRQTDSDTGASPLSGLPYKEVKQSTESLAARGAPSLAPPPHQRCADHLLPHRIDFAPRGSAALPLW